MPNSSRPDEHLNLNHVGEVCAIIARHAPLIIEHQENLEDRELSRYWFNSRRRFIFWTYALDDCNEALRRDQPLSHYALRTVRTISREVLVSEILTRLWSAVLVECDRKRGEKHFSPIARRVFKDHLSLRRSVLKLMLHKSALPDSLTIELDRYRRKTERWTDCLLGTMPPQVRCSEFAFDQERYQDFAADRSLLRRVATSHAGWRLTELSLRMADTELPPQDQTRLDLHRAILDSVSTSIEHAISGANEPSPKLVEPDPMVENEKSVSLDFRAIFQKQSSLLN